MEEKIEGETFRDKIIAMLPEGRRLDMMKVINDAGLRADDEAFALYYVMGYVKTLYEDMPDAVEQMNRVVWQMAETLDASMQAQLQKSISGMKSEMQAQSSRAVGDIQKISLGFSALLQSHDDKIRTYANLIEAENEKIREKSRQLFISAMRSKLPELIEPYLQQMVDGPYTFKRIARDFLVWSSSMGLVLVGYELIKWFR
ncbi:MAG: hypothetical protein Q8M05_16360 [Rhodoferax sp.]|uniref:hypothetical protein n=1 Tax=Rhodoferax sp. TaxID=50421 RepID=UPI002731459C|nr:hypothetical protein [Rhodoferax sp.]MDP1530951.1 hypothetical protein [Rhodoferax sp.]MDP1942583.1 hypothetical protein [Rhodoferax sp.]MDP3193227.1 hypothetical protein [Rhodoferax sp.]MDP3865276.1 hypothetical protein [Rhodoferax sp.]